MPHFHLSLQAGDDMILKRMKRRHLRDRHHPLLRGGPRLRPDVVFGADIIAGFPTETEAMFENSLDRRGMRPDPSPRLPVLAREGTPAARMPQLDRARSSRNAIFTKRKLDEATLEELEDILIQADLGVDTAMADHRARCPTAATTRKFRLKRSAKVLAEEVEKVLALWQAAGSDLGHKPHVILVVGVNGTGKTTTIGKLCRQALAPRARRDARRRRHFPRGCRRAAQDLGRAHRREGGCPRSGADAAGLAFEAIERPATDGADVLIIDTAGRLQNRTELMDELEKVIRVIIGKHRSRRAAHLCSRRWTRQPARMRSTRSRSSAMLPASPAW
jgi:hypothetical protein